MSDHPYLARARKGDIDTMASVLADDIVWHVPGDHQLSGDYEGKEEVLGFFGRLMQETEGMFENEVHDILANDEHGVALVDASATRNGKTISDKNIHVFHMRDGEMTEFWTVPTDQAAWNDF